MLNWGFAHAGSQASRVSLLPRPRVLASLTTLCRGGYMDMAPMDAKKCSTRNSGYKNVTCRIVNLVAITPPFSQREF